jgi:prepilin-type N-terminal cleavage/methylation domain-containing protein
MRRKGFTLVELLVVIAIIALLMGILMPALARVRQLAFRMTCGSNLSGIGKAMLLYANDYDDELPRGAGRNSSWNMVTWYALTRAAAYNVTSTDGTGGQCTISSCFYLLVKYAEVTPKSFLCKGDSGVSEFTMTGETTPSTGITELTQAWEFGATPTTKCSYTYHSPWGTYALTTSSEPGFAVAADRNPWQVSPGVTTAKTFPSGTSGSTTVTFAGKGGTSADQLYGNSTVHQEDGQNVMFLDTHVTFEKRSYCSLEDDNIYTVSTYTDKGDATGKVPFSSSATAANAAPANRKDSVLVHDPGTFGGASRSS